MYVDAIHDRNQDKILVAERRNGTRHLVEWPVERSFYYDDPNGKYTSIFLTPCSIKEHTDARKFQADVKKYWGKTYESDINPIFKCLAANYRGLPNPDLHVTFFDIEADFNPDLGYAPSDDPFNAITAIGLHHVWQKTSICLALIPSARQGSKPYPGMSLQEAQAAAQICQENMSHTSPWGAPDIRLFEREEDMIEEFLHLIEDTDVLSGYNSEGYDIPYLVNRMRMILPERDLTRLCLWGEYPRKRSYERYGRKQYTYDLVGRVHMDWFQVYMKREPSELHSYKLDFVAKVEGFAGKVPYSGTLDELYYLNFEQFLEYNIVDVELLVLLENKKRYIGLANQLAHTNTVLLPTTMGSVALIEQAIINEAHDMGLVVPDKRRPGGGEDNENQDNAVAGAYVVDPKVGLHDWVGSVDIASLYPSIIRSLNISPETIVAQLDNTQTREHLQQRVQTERLSMAGAWGNIFGTLEYQMVLDGTSDQNISVYIETPQGVVKQDMTAQEIHQWIWAPNSGVCISANGTVFTTEREGVIPHILTRWYKERKEMKWQSAICYKLSNEGYKWNRK